MLSCDSSVVRIREAAARVVEKPIQRGSRWLLNRDLGLFPSLNSKSRRDGKNMPEKIVSDPTQDKALKPNQKEKPVRADEPVTGFEAKLNKWGFIHVPKKALPSLPFEAEEPLTARIEGQALVIRKA